MKRLLSLLIAGILTLSLLCACAEAPKEPIDIGEQAGPTVTMEAEIVTTTEDATTEATTTEAVTTTTSSTVASDGPPSPEGKATEATTTEAVTTTTGGASPAPTTEAEPESERSPTAWEVAEDMNLGVNFGNALEAHYTDGTENFKWCNVVGNNNPIDYERCWGATPATQNSVDGLKAAGFDTLRIPVYWGNMMSNDGKWRINPRYMARVKEVVDYTQKADMYAVINIHHFDEFIVRRYDNKEAAEIFTILWTQIAEAFKDYDYRVIFEGYNENMGGARLDAYGKAQDRSRSDAYDLTNRCNQAFVDAVRATGGNNAERVLIASGYWTNIDLTTEKEFKMPKDTVEDRLMVSVHYVDNAIYWSEKIGTTEWLEYIDDQCDKLDKAFTSKGIPVFLGETSASYPADRIPANAQYKTSEDCLRYVLEELSDRGYVAALWITGNDYYSHELNKMSNKTHAVVVKDIAEKLR